MVFLFCFKSVGMIKKSFAYILLLSMQGSVNMRSVKKRSSRTVGVITAIIIVPVLVIGALNNSPAFSQLAKKATVVSAGITFWSGGQDNSTDGVAISANSTKVQQVTQATIQTPKSLAFDESQTISANPLWSLELAPQEVETPLPQAEAQQQIVQPQTQAKVSDMLQALPYPTSLETKSGVIKQMTYTAYSGNTILNLATAGQVKNCTSITNASLMTESKLLPEFKIQLNAEPQVLIMHTHTTESYEPYDRDFYDASFNSRTTDTTKNVVAVGDAIEQELKNAGIVVIHDETIHDYPSYNGSYDRSRVTVQAILKKYPSIKVVLDVHRDAIQSTDGVRNAPIATINGKKAAQIMIISGCDDGTMNMPNYMKNFRLSSLLQQQLESDYKGLTRPVLFDYRHYNQDLTTGSILLEMGGHGNSIDEAVYSGQLMGKSLAKALLKCK